MTLVVRSFQFTSATLATALLLSACGGQPPPPVEAPKTPAADAKPAEAKAEPAHATPAPEAAATPDAAPEEPATKTRPPSGRPPVLKMDSEEISDTFGSTPAAKLELGDDKSRAVLRIPEYAFDRGVNVTFKIDKKGKNNGGLVGKIYHTLAQVAGATEYRTIDSAGPPFLLEMPAGTQKNANLAIGEILVGEGTMEKVTWHVIAPTKIDDLTSTAYFELPSIGDFYIHVTTRPVAAKPADKPKKP